MNRRARQFSCRFWEPYDELVVRKARQAGIKPNQLVRIATMAFVDMELLSVHERLSEIEESIGELYREFRTAFEASL